MKLRGRKFLHLVAGTAALMPVLLIVMLAAHHAWAQTTS
jgi:hypothetical protein